MSVANKKRHVLVKKQRRLANRKSERDRVRLAVKATSVKNKGLEPFGFTLVPVSWFLQTEHELALIKERVAKFNSLSSDDRKLQTKMFVYVSTGKSIEEVAEELKIPLDECLYEYQRCLQEGVLIVVSCDEANLLKERRERYESNQTSIKEVVNA